MNQLQTRTRRLRRINPGARNPSDTLFIVVNPVGSKFAKALQQALQTKVDHKVLRVRTPLVDRKNFIVTQQVLNKVEQFERFRQAEISSPSFSTNEMGAREFDCKTIFARQLINSTNGRGIIEFNSTDEQYPSAPLYTEYIPKRAEYRVHVFNGEVIDIQEKRKKRDWNDSDRSIRIRNSNNGYVYCRDDLNPPDGITTLAINAVNACSYTYGAVDIIYNEKRDQCYVLEVNSRPGLMGTTLDKYSEALIKQFELRRLV